MKGKIYKVILFIVAIVFGVHALGLFGYYIYCSVNAEFHYTAPLVFVGYIAPAVMSVVMLVDDRRGRKSNWLLMFLLAASAVFAISMTADLLHYYFTSIPLPSNLIEQGYDERYALWGAYLFNQYYIPTALTPMFVWLMVRFRQRLSFVPQYFDADTKLEHSFKKLEAVFYGISYGLAFALLAAALIGLMTGGGWGVVVSMLWGWTMLVPLIISLSIWLGLNIKIRRVVARQKGTERCMI